MHANITQLQALAPTGSYQWGRIKTLLATISLAVVSCYAEEDVPGFMSSLGLIDDRCVLRPFDAKGGGGVPTKFRGVDWVYPM